MDGATSQFRDEYRAGVAPGYRGQVHAAIVLSIGLGGMGLAVFRWGVPGLGSAWVAVATLLFANFVIYGIHRWLGHRLVPIAKLFYQRHTREHHRFFSPKAVAFESYRDLRVVLFPWPLMVVVSLAAAGTAWGAELLGKGAWSTALYCAVVGYYLAYEVIHFCDHLPEGHPVTRLPGLRYMRMHHRAHHAARVMHTKNFNIVFPLADLVLGTLLSRDAMHEHAAMDR